MPRNKDTKELVVLLHGIARSSKHMSKLASCLQKEGYEVLNLDYPSTKYSIEDLADMVYEAVECNIQKQGKVHFVGYSMRAIVIRAMLNKYKFDNLGRVVQLAPPNSGSEVADFLSKSWIYNKFYGPAGKQLTTKAKLNFGKIDYELGVIAGNFSIDPISSLIIRGRSDGKVSIKSTMIKGMKDHIVVSASHTFFPSNKEVQRQTVAFLKGGRFQRQ